MSRRFTTGASARVLRALVIGASLVAVETGTRGSTDVPIAPQPVPSPSRSPTSATRPAPGGIDPVVFEMALGAASCVVRSGAAARPSTLTVIDYSKPSTAKRMWVFDLPSHQLLFNELVAHGQGSGDNLAVRFSNEPETHRSSLGLFVTANAYVGKHGYSLRLDGLDRGFNDRARERAIVLHGAPYVSTDFVATQGRLGRSWGCPAVREDVAKAIIDRVKDGNLLFAYYPDQAWLESSRYLGGCAAAD